MLLDFHVRNLAFVCPGLREKTEEELMQLLGEPEALPVKRRDGEPNEPFVPHHQISSATWPSLEPLLTLPLIKIIDFGESFLMSDPPDRTHTPLRVRAPEAILKDKIDYRVDLWSMGCLVCCSPFLHDFLYLPAQGSRVLLVVDDANILTQLT
jgi:serine/threonine-protein kinase SRPK3